MPPKSANDDGKARKTYSADAVAAVLMATGTTSLSMRHYELMSCLDGVKTASAFQHDFRAVLAKAKELKGRVNNGEVFEPVAPVTKRAVAVHSHLQPSPRQLRSPVPKRSSRLPDTHLPPTLSHHTSTTTLRYPISTRLVNQKQHNMVKAADSPAGVQKMIPADCVSVLLMALGNTSITKEQLNMMSAIDGTRTASSFEHQFRSITAKAKELKKRLDNGETFAPVLPAQKRGGTATPAAPKRRKGDDADDTPSKKPKATPKPRGKKAQVETPPTPQPADDDVNLPEDMADFIKSEQKWEKDQFI